MNLLWQIERHLKETGTPATRFGRMAVKDPRLVHDLRRGRQPGPRMKCRVRAFMSNFKEETRSCDQ